MNDANHEKAAAELMVLLCKLYASGYDAGCRETVEPRMLPLGFNQSADDEKAVREFVNEHKALRRLLATPQSQQSQCASERVCHCGRTLIYNRGDFTDPDPWCSGCNMSAKACDCALVPARVAGPRDELAEARDRLMQRERDTCILIDRLAKAIHMRVLDHTTDEAIVDRVIEHLQRKQ